MEILNYLSLYFRAKQQFFNQIDLVLEENNTLEHIKQNTSLHSRDDEAGKLLTHVLSEKEQYKYSVMKIIQFALFIVTKFMKLGLSIQPEPQQEQTYGTY